MLHGYRPTSPSECYPDIPPYMRELDFILNPLLDAKFPDREFHHGEILDKPSYLLLIALLLNDPNVEKMILQAMHFEPKYDHETNHLPWGDPRKRVNVLHYALAFPQCAFELILDRFAYEFERGNWLFREYGKRRFNPKLKNSRILSDFSFLNSRKKSFKVLDHRSNLFQMREVIRGILSKNIHQVADAWPGLPINILRWHDHRKIVIVTLKDGTKFLLLLTGNFDAPTAHDCALIVMDPKIIAAFEQLQQHPPDNAVIDGEGWSIYQDGMIDPKRYPNPEECSPILNKTRELLGSEDTQTVRWSSQFLPGVEELKLLEAQLERGILQRLDIFTSFPEHWGRIHVLGGGWQSLSYLQQLIKKYPQKVRLHFSKRQTHAKTILINGKSLFIGSSNNYRQLIRSRTVEWMLFLEKMDQNTQAELEQFFAQIECDCVETREFSFLSLFLLKKSSRFSQ